MPEKCPWPKPLQPPWASAAPVIVDKLDLVVLLVATATMVSTVSPASQAIAARQLHQHLR